MMLNGNLADQLAAQLNISRQAIEEATRRGLLSFIKHRSSRCWRFGDVANGCFRRIDGQPFKIRGELVKAEAETSGEFWHRLIGLDEAVANDRRDILLMLEGSKDAPAALHFADVEGTLSSVGVVVALGTGIHLRAEDVEKFRGQRVRIIADAEPAGKQAAVRIRQEVAACADEVQILDLAGLNRDDDVAVKDLFDATRIGYDDFEANRDLWSVTDLSSKGERVSVLTKDDEFPFSPLPAFSPLPSPPHLLSLMGFLCILCLIPKNWKKSFRNALSINGSLAQLGVIDLVRVGDPRPRGKASEFRYNWTAALKSKPEEGTLISQWNGDPGDARFARQGPK